MYMYNRYPCYESTLSLSLKYLAVKDKTIYYCQQTAHPHTIYHKNKIFLSAALYERVKENIRLVYISDKDTKSDVNS